MWKKDKYHSKKLEMCQYQLQRIFFINFNKLALTICGLAPLIMINFI